MNNKIWGGRFNKALNPLAAQFNASLPFDHVLFAHDIKGSQIHARMLEKQGLITPQEGQQIVHALTEIQQEISNGQYAFNHNFEDIHSFIEHLLIKKIGDTGKKLHTGRSRNDQVALDLRLYSREAGQHITQLLTQLLACLDHLAIKHAENLMPGYTHLQQAQPIYLGTFFAAYHAMFSRDHSRLNDWHARMNFSPLGAGALAGSQLPLDRHWCAEQLGFNGIIENTLDAVSDRDFVIELCSAASLIMMHLSRLSEDLIVWATQEFNFVSLDDAFATGSSLMPNKKNPDLVELIRGKSGRVFGHLMGILTVMKGLPLAYNKDMQEDKEALFDTINTLIACLQIITPFLNSLTFNTALMQQRSQEGYLDATAWLEKLILQGVPFRDAHHQIGKLVAKARAKQCSLQDVIVEEELVFVENQTSSVCMHMQAKPKHVLTGMELTAADLRSLLNQAKIIKKSPQSWQTALAGQTLAMIFEKPSFRTRLSFAAAIQSLGGHVIESVSSTRKQEDARDTIRVLNNYADFVMVRTHEQQVLTDMAEHAAIPIINGLSAVYHPCQILADLLTLEESFSALAGLTLSYIGDGNNILNSLMLMAPYLGIKINYCCPQNNQPQASILAQAHHLHAGLVEGFPTPQAAVKNACAIYTDVWTSMGFTAKNPVKAFAGFQVNEQLMAMAATDAKFMHCMPMERGNEVTDAVADSPASLIFKQSENRLHIQKAILLFLNRR